MNEHEMFALFQSFLLSFIVIWPVLMIARYVYRQNTPHSWQMRNWSDSMVRPLAFVIFLVMLASAVYILIEKRNYYALIGPIEVFLMFFFLPLYKKMD